jgi:hypothetical protein
VRRISDHTTRRVSFVTPVGLATIRTNLGRPITPELVQVTVTDGELVEVTVTGRLVDTAGLREHASAEWSWRQLGVPEGHRAPWPPEGAPQLALDAVEGVRSMMDPADLARWLVSMDDPEDVLGREARRTVTLDSIIRTAREALGGAS